MFKSNWFVECGRIWIWDSSAEEKREINNDESAAAEKKDESEMYIL